MSRAAQGKTVRFHYTGSLADGTVFNSSMERGRCRSRSATAR